MGNGWIDRGIFSSIFLALFSLIRLSFISEFDDTPKGGSFSFQLCMY